MFFRMAIKFVAVALFFQLVIMLPIHHADTGDWGLPSPIQSGNQTNGTSPDSMAYYVEQNVDFDTFQSPSLTGNDGEAAPSERMLWLYLFFTYLSSALALYLIVSETKKIISIRQAYLGSQSTITDRTIRLSGIPEDLRSEDKIKDTIEELGIGKVESVLLCKDWTEIDNLFAKRKTVLRKLEQAWTEYLEAPKGQHKTSQSHHPSNGDTEDDEENARLLDSADPDHKDDGRERPQARLWYGFLGLQSRKIDAIDYYEEKLRKLSDKTVSTRKKVFKPMPLAFVTLDSTASAVSLCVVFCQATPTDISQQMAVQALVDPEPMQLVARLAPPPGDVVWPNTYLSRSTRMFRAWSITLFVAVLTVLWAIILIPISGLLSLENIGRVSPQLRDALNSHQISRALVQTGLPTLLFSGLAVAVPYLYYWLATLQGMDSLGDIETSLINKNFFFTFFNLFLFFTVFGTVFTAKDYFDQIGNRLKDTISIAYVLARSLKSLVLFYMNLIVLQGLALFPFRLLEFGSVALYPFYKVSSKTPRDYAELVQPPVFSYGFYLPQTLFIFIICIVYSVLPGSWFILFFGLLYFLLGGFIYKYQLLYAMDHRQHSTGRAWPIMCNWTMLGLLVFQLAMAGILGLSLAIKRAVLVAPLLAFTVWFMVYYQRQYEPLMKFIAIRSLTHESPLGGLQPSESRYEADTAGRRNVDESDETGLRYMNPSLVLPLEEAWLPKQGQDAEAEGVRSAELGGGESGDGG